MTDQKSETSSSKNDPFDILKIITQLKVWGERLLDLTKGNPLLGINRSRVSKLQVKTPDIESLFKMLVLDEAAIKMPLILIKNKRKKQDEAQLKIKEVEDSENEPDCIVHPGDVDFEADPKTLYRLLKRIYDNGRSTVEERGVTTLHLTFGILNWNDPILGESSSPLLLVPCQLESYGPNSHMRLKMLDEELQVNPALEFYLRKKHHIDLPAFSEEPTIESLKLFFSQVQDCINEQRWKIDSKSWLSTFTFESLVMYKDLQTMVEIAQDNSLIAALANARTISERSEVLDDELDNLDVPKVVPIPVMAADASQLEALTIAQSGKHLVIKGPPGTGKSQTITNLIAEAIGNGKKVLFVSAKMAALNVVHDRLSRLGLGRFCLEAHSTKAGKLKIIEELKRTLEMPLSGNGTLLEEQLEELKKIKANLNSYVKEIHLPREPLGKTIYQAVGKLERLNNFASLEFDLPWSDITDVSREQLGEILEALENIGVQSNIFDKKDTHPWRGFVVESGQPISSDVIKKNLQIIIDVVEDFKNALEKLKDLLVPVESEFKLSELITLLQALNSLAITDELPKGWISKTEDELKDLEDLFESAVTKSEEYQYIKKTLKRATPLSSEELLDLLKPINEQFSSWTRVVNPNFWKWKSSIRSQFTLNADTSNSTLHSYFDIATTLEKIDAWFNSKSKMLTKYVNNPNVNSKLLRGRVVHFKTARELQIAISKNILKRPKKEILNITPQYHKSISKIIETLENKDFEGSIAIIESGWSDGFIDGEKIEDSTLSSIQNRSKEVFLSIQKMHEWIVLQSLISKCENLDLSNFLLGLEKVGAKNASEIFEKKFYSQWIETLLNANPSLLEFTGSLHEEKISQFKDLDRKLQISMLKRIQYDASEPARSVIGAQNNFGNGGEVGILRKELQKRKRIKPLRKLFNEIPHVLQALKPCMLMSPVSVSTFLKPGSISFDLVVFDEASQLPTPEAIPSILRGKQIIVAGDENQLPPTSFFSASTIFEEENELDSSEEFEPLESLLDNCIAIEPVFQERKIVWHYRSKDERLIQFSNHYFYRTLITFPSSTTSSEGRGVHLVYTENGTWDRGRSRTNRIEAKRVAEIVVEQFKKYPERSLGVASMNASQKEAIEDALDELISNKPELQALLDTNRAEPFFVKSLENVQGDERDTIIICIGYAKMPTGALSLNFGPLNSEGGWRRLNVLVTRAKWQTILVTSLRSHELSAINPLNKGAIMLRNYIQYVEQGGKLPSDPVTATNDETNDFEDSIATSLRDRGLVVDEQVGASEYRIDLAIRDPRDRNRYIMAVECDGATYHHTKTARDRDMLREEVLRSQGWKIYRVWSTDWFRNREEALKGILSGLEAAKRAPAKDSVLAKPIIQDANNTEVLLSNDLSTERQSMVHKRKYKIGVPYHKYSLNKRRSSRELLNKNGTVQLAIVITSIVKYESPIHRDVIIERLKEIYGVSRAGANIQKNVTYAIERSVRWSDLINREDFIYKTEGDTNVFRVPAEGVVRGLNQIAPEEIENAILYLVEDQFGFAREHISKAILEAFGIGKNRTEPIEIIESVVDRLLRKKKLNLNSHTLYLS